jgi:hypothetical protein
MHAGLEKDRSWRCIPVALIAFFTVIEPGSAEETGSKAAALHLARSNSTVTLDVTGTPRRTVLSQLFNGSNISFEWLDAPAGDVAITGKFSGTAGEIARKLLSDTDFVVVYESGGRTQRISRVVIVGPSSGQPNATALAALERASVDTPSAQSPKPAAPPAPVSSKMDVPQRPVLAPDVKIDIIPPPPGMELPPLTPPADATAPTLTPSTGSAAPLLVAPGDSGLPIRQVK